MAQTKELRFKYDRDAYVLYCSFGDARPSLSVEARDGVVLRLDPETEEVIGFTVVDFFKRFAERPEESVPVPLVACAAPAAM